MVDFLIAVDGSVAENEYEGTCCRNSADGLRYLRHLDH